MVYSPTCIKVWLCIHVHACTCKALLAILLSTGNDLLSGPLNMLLRTASNTFCQGCVLLHLRCDSCIIFRRCWRCLMTLTRSFTRPLETWPTHCKDSLVENTTQLILFGSGWGTFQFVILQNCNHLYTSWFHSFIELWTVGTLCL